jgi:lipopolysaccharide export system protein LptC
VIHFYRYISAVTVLLIAFSTYAVAVAPWLEPPPIPRGANIASGPVTPPVTDDTKKQLATLFPPGHWVLGDPKIVETEQCMLLIQDYKPVEGGNLELKPCVLIFGARGAATTIPADGSPPAKRARPIILEAPKAELAFDKPLDVTRAAFGRVEKGTLAGEVTIYSPPTTPTSGDALHVKTRAVWLDRQSIRTSNDVEFQYGDSSGRGRILEIALKSSEEGSKQKSKSPMGPIQTVTLRHLDYFRLATAGRGVLGNALPNSKSPPGVAGPQPAAGSTNNDNAPIELRCQGEFTFDCMAQVARFEKQVEVKRLLPNVAPDTLRCDELMLHFGEPQNPPAAGDAAAANADPLAGRLQKLIAIGAPAVLESPTSALRAVAAHMEYSVVSQQVVLKANAQRNVTQVSLVQNQQHFIAPELQYQMSESKRLGRLLATGPGELRMLHGEGVEQQTITARWGKTLQIQPQELFQVISLVQAASVTIDPMGRFDGNELHLWVQEAVADDGSAAIENGRARLLPLGGMSRAPSQGHPQTVGPAGASTSPIAADSPTTSLIPHRLVGTGGVRVVSEQLDVDTNRLQAWFIHLPPNATDASPQRLPPIAPPPIREPVQPAAYLPASEPQAAIRDIKPPSLQRFHVGGEQIQLQAIIRGRAFELEDLLIDGKADILETRTPEPNLEPIFARGSRLELRHGSVPAATTVKIDGQPAETGGRGMTLAGRTIDLARGKNELRIDGYGEATMPMQGTGDRGQRAGDRSQGSGAGGPTLGMMPFAGPAGPAGPAKNVTPQKLHIVWHDGLIFDGLTARITGDVEMRTATPDAGQHGGTAQLARAPVLEVMLKDRFDFQSMGRTPGLPTSTFASQPASSPAGQPQLARVFLDGGMTGVYGKNDGFDEAGHLVSCEQLRSRNVTMDMLTNELYAQGPGWVSSVRKGSPQGPGAIGQEPVAKIQGPVGPPNAEANQLTSIHVAFEKEMVGDLKARQITFHQQVETTYSPANDFADVIAADAIKDLSERVVLMTSDSLKVTEFLQPPPRWIEVEAIGNTKVRGQKFDVDAPIVAYSSQKETIKIEGNGRASAKAWVRQNPGDKPTSFEGERFTYNLRTGAFTPEVVKGIHFNLPPNMKLGVPAMPGGTTPTGMPATTPTKSSRRFP